MVQISRRFDFRKIFIIGLSLIILVAGIWFYYSKEATDGIHDYKPSRDRQFIVDLFKGDNFYWLVNDPAFSPEYMVDNKASSKKLKDKGNLTIKTYLKEKKPVGFTAYYEKPLFEGFVLFLAVDAPHRGKGYARQLLTYAIEDLKKRGSIVIRLLTRIDNERARNLYGSMGFKPKISDRHVYYEKKLTV